MFVERCFNRMDPEKKLQKWVEALETQYPGVLYSIMAHNDEAVLLVTASPEEVGELDELGYDRKGGEYVGD